MGLTLLQMPLVLSLAMTDAAVPGVSLPPALGHIRMPLRTVGLLVALAMLHGAD